MSRFGAGGARLLVVIVMLAESPEKDVWEITKALGVASS